MLCYVQNWLYIQLLKYYNGCSGTVSGCLTSSLAVVSYAPDTFICILFVYLSLDEQEKHIQLFLGFLVKLTQE